MQAGQWFWLIYVLFLILGVFFNWPRDPNTPYAWRPVGWTVIVFILIGLLGWGIFGSPLK